VKNNVVTAITQKAYLRQLKDAVEDNELKYDIFIDPFFNSNIDWM
jgi:hypothetical protein